MPCTNLRGLVERMCRDHGVQTRAELEALLRAHGRDMAQAIEAAAASSAAKPAPKPPLRGSIRDHIDMRGKFEPWPKDARPYEPAPHVPMPRARKRKSAPDAEGERKRSADRQRPVKSKRLKRTRPADPKLAPPPTPPNEVASGLVELAEFAATFRRANVLAEKMLRMQRKLGA